MINDIMQFNQGLTLWGVIESNKEVGQMAASEYETTCKSN